MIRQFRYDSDRGRYLTRERSTDPAKFAKPIGDRWTEYLGDEPYRDFEVDVTEDPCQPSGYDATVVPTRRYIRGYGLCATEDENGNIQFIHGDLLGSTRLMTEGSDAQTLGEPTARGEYLAFGQVVDLASLLGGTGVSPVPGIRYGWCGSWGYQTDALEDLGASWSAGPVATGGTPTLADDEQEIGLLHIGARYYSPDLGRWVQRDPIGIEGGLNVYRYVANLPTILIDPSGWASSTEIGVVAAQIASLVARLTPAVVAGQKLAQTLISRGFGNNPGIIVKILENGKMYYEAASGRFLSYYDKLALVLEYGDDAWTIITFFEQLTNPALIMDDQGNPRFVRCQGSPWRRR